MITGKKNLLIASLEIVAVGICLKIGYHIGNKLIGKLDGAALAKKKLKNKENEEVFGGRKRVVESVTGEKLAILSP